MDYKILGTLYPILSLSLNKGEQILCQTQSVLSLSKDIEMKTEVYGGITKGVRRMAGGDSVFLSTLTAMEDGQTIDLADHICGNILPLAVDKDHSYLCERSAYLCSEPGVDLDVAFLTKIRVGIFGGEGIVLERLSGEGKVFLHGSGELIKKTMVEGEELKITSGRVMAFSTTISMDIEFVKSISNILFSGRGLFVTTLTGHGDVYIQSFSKYPETLDGKKGVK